MIDGERVVVIVREPDAVCVGETILVYGVGNEVVSLSPLGAMRLRRQLGEALRGGRRAVINTYGGIEGFHR